MADVIYLACPLSMFIAPSNRTSMPPARCGAIGNLELLDTTQRNLKMNISKPLLAITFPSPDLCPHQLRESIYCTPCTKGFETPVSLQHEDWTMGHTSNESKSIERLKELKLKKDDSFRYDLHPLRSRSKRGCIL